MYCRFAGWGDGRLKVAGKLIAPSQILQPGPADRPGIDQNGWSRFRGRWQRGRPHQGEGGSSPLLCPPDVTIAHVEAAGVVVGCCALHWVGPAAAEAGQKRAETQGPAAKTASTCLACRALTAAPS